MPLSPLLPLIKQLVRRTGVLFIIFLAAWLVPLFVNFPKQYDARISLALKYVAVFALFFQAVIWANTFITFWCDLYIERHTQERGEQMTIRVIAIMAKVVLGIFLAIGAFQFGLDKSVTGLVAGLGVGGIAVAFALQNILSDLFAALSIVTDKPFVIGDSIGVDSYSGTVEHIGLKSTRVRSDEGEQIVFGNSDLLKGRIRNYGRMEERRGIVNTRVAGITTPAQLSRIPQIFKHVIEQRASTRFVRSTLTGFADNGIDFTTVYYVTNPSYQLYAETQQAVMLDALRAFETEKIDLAAQFEAVVKQTLANRSDGNAPATAAAAEAVARETAPPPTTG